MCCCLEDKKKLKMDQKDKIELNDIWPQERDFIFRPDRLKYVRRLKNDENCVFCSVVEAKVPSENNLCIYKSEQVHILLNKYPYNTGHLLVVPNKHIGSMFDLDDSDYLEMMKAVRFASKLLTKVYGVKGLNVGVNHGKVAGAGIPDHLHWHVIPRWFGDTNFFPVIAETKVLPETLEQTWNKLYPAVTKLLEEKGGKL